MTLVRNAFNCTLLICLCALIILFAFNKLTGYIPKFPKKQPSGTVFGVTHIHADNASNEKNEAEALREKVRVLCWIMTSPNSLYSKAKHVKSTWAKRCDVFLFMSSKADKHFPAIGLNVSEGRDHLTAKTMLAFDYVYKHHFNDADWFVKADDDTYMIVENLRYFLSNKNFNDPVYYGHHFKVIVKQGYFSGGAGYVLSREALKRLVFNRKKRCRRDGGAEDVELGLCMQKLGVKAGNSTDKLGRSRFHCFDPQRHTSGAYPKWYLKYDSNGAKNNSISDYAISFHYVKGKDMYLLEFLIYHLRPYGIVFAKQDLN